MGHKIAIDFGTTNSVIAHWNNDTAEIVAIPKISAQAAKDHPVSVVPSLLYVKDGKAGTMTCGQSVRDEGLDRQQDNRLFRNFKRGIVSSPAPDPRTIDDTQWADRDAGRSFVPWPNSNSDVSSAI